MEEIWVKSTQRGIIIKHTNPNFYHRFDEKPVKIKQETFDFVEKTNPGLLIKVDTPEEPKIEQEKKVKSSFEKLPKLNEK